MKFRTCLRIHQVNYHVKLTIKCATSSEILDLSSEVARDISATKSLTSYEIYDLSNYMSSELSRQITDLETQTTGGVIADLSSSTFYTIDELETVVNDLSGRTKNSATTHHKCII